MNIRLVLVSEAATIGFSRPARAKRGDGDAAVPGVAHLLHGPAAPVAFDLGLHVRLRLPGDHPTAAANLTLVAAD